MSIGVIVGLAFAAAMVALAWVIDRMSRPGRVYPGRGTAPPDDRGANLAVATALMIPASSFSAGDGGGSCDAGSSGGDC